MTARIERKRRLLDLCRCRRSPGGEEARPDPLDEVVACHIVCAHDDHALAASELNPIRSHGDGLGRARTRCIGLSIRSLSADVLGELRVSHAQNLEEEATVEVSLTEVTISADELCELIVPRERRGEDHSRVCAHLLGQLPSRRHLLALAGRVVSLDERNLGVLQRLNARCKGELRRDVQRSNPIGVDAVLLREIKVGFDSSEANDLLALLNSLEGSLTGLGILMEPNDVLRQERILYVVTQ